LGKQDATPTGKRPQSQRINDEAIGAFIEAKIAAARCRRLEAAGAQRDDPTGAA
jgi:hypothetical protein